MLHLKIVHRPRDLQPKIKKGSEPKTNGIPESLQGKHVLKPPKLNKK